MNDLSPNAITPERPAGLALLRVPFPQNQISKLPKATKKQTEEVRADFKKGIRCNLCGQWHHPDVVHLDYVGHAALTDRLLDCDPNWNWEPMALKADNTPLFDENGGMWIRLTVCGVTRIGYGHPDGKRGGDAIKEVIGDALRNAAMRFGAALDLWHKGDLHVDEAPETTVVEPPKEIRPEPAKASPEQHKTERNPQVIRDWLLSAIKKADREGDLDAINAEGGKPAAAWQWLEDEHPDEAATVKKAFDARKAALTDEIPY